MTPSDRDAKGRFNGASGNPNGRPKKKSERLLTIADLDDITLRVASTPVNVAIDGKSLTVTVFEQTMWAMATGKASNRLAVGQFATLVRSAAYGRERRSSEEERRSRRLDT